MQTVQQRFEALNLNEILSEDFKYFLLMEEYLSDSDKFRLKRFKHIFAITIEKFKDATPSNTPFIAFANMQSYLASIYELVDKLKKDEAVGDERNAVFQDLDSMTENMLNLLPSINTVFDSDSRATETIRNYSLVQEYSNAVKQIQVEASNQLAELENYKIKGQKLSQLLANKVLNNDYHNRATAEKWAARSWTAGTIISAAVTVGLLIYIFIHQLDAAANNTVNYSLLSTKILMTATLGFIAKWTSKRAGRHLAEESKYHRLAVNVETVNSFIAPLSDAGKEAVLSAVAIKMFTDGAGNETPTEFETASIVDVAKAALTKTEKT